jgi:hypothetical protein
MTGIPHTNATVNPIPRLIGLILSKSQQKASKNLTFKLSKTGWGKCIKMTFAKCSFKIGLLPILLLAFLTLVAVTEIRAAAGPPPKLNPAFASDPYENDDTLEYKEFCKHQEQLRQYPEKIKGIGLCNSYRSSLSRRILRKLRIFWMCLYH